MEMARSRSGGSGKVVTFDDAVSAGRRRNGGSLPSYLDIGSNKTAVEAAGRVARPLPATGMGSRRRTYADGELDVFAAERYFKGIMDGGDRMEAGAVAVPAAAAAAPVDKMAAARPAADQAVVMARPPSSTRASTASFTTTASSAASSQSAANSQTALFRGGGHRRRGGSGGRSCCVQVGVLVRTCSGKRSVHVDDGRAAAKEAAHGGGEATATGVDWYRELRMQKAAHGLPAGDVGNGLPPSLNLGTAKVAAIVGREMTLTTREEKAAASSSMRRSFTLVAPVRAANNVPSASGRAAADDEKHVDEEEYKSGGSESSSDLFEIKSLMIEECSAYDYEPSEASIQWSVVTASATDAPPEQRGGGRGPVAAAGSTGRAGCWRGAPATGPWTCRRRRRRR
ncbi:unnamed protein product [Urochloa humidicola]